MSREGSMTSGRDHSSSSNTRSDGLVSQPGNQTVSLKKGTLEWNANSNVMQQKNLEVLILTVVLICRYLRMKR